MLKITCCKDCDKRELTCHDRCEIYQEQKRLANEAKKEKYKNMEYVSYLRSRRKKSPKL